MSCGIVVCSQCNHEIHQDGDRSIRNGWRHCEDRSSICIGASAVFPISESSIRGEWCGRDGRDRGPSAIRRLEKVGRNDPCPCGSKKKSKKCCGNGMIL